MPMTPARPLLVLLALPLLGFHPAQTTRLRSSPPRPSGKQQTVPGPIAANRTLDITEAESRSGQPSLP